MKALSVALTFIFTLAGCGAGIPNVTQVAAHEESERLYWCMNPDGVWDVYSDRIAIQASDCKPENYSRGRWDHYPLTVGAEDSLEKETIEAIRYMNDALGFEMFVYSQGDLTVDIAAITMGNHVFAAAEAKLLTYEGRMRGAILAYNGLEDGDRADIIAHELGHLLGLRHDHENNLSLMYPSASSRLARLEPQDIKLIRRVYHQR